MDTPALEARAIQKHLRKSPRKVRLVVDVVRGKSVEEALKTLEFLKQAASDDVIKVVKSAAANLRDKFQEERFDNEDIYIKEIYVDEGVTLKRIQPAPMGRAHRINKRSSHITVKVAKRNQESVN
ncbi:MAG: 50S ribosomal protein L22 [Balneola sp.]|nr:50S ribosomal protein L22 [Balneola sp.]|tara:strand:- start:1966 stop:2340 length:375 start_codon:yes stop_codon:yes gene_type:complete